MSICIEISSESIDALHEMIFREVDEFDHDRHIKNGCVPLSEYEIQLLEQFLEYLVSKY